MENAAKALLMAGGILFAIIVISVLMLGYSDITKMKQEEANKEVLQEINKFNEPYLAFNKKVMYGTDVISVLNRVINNNKIYKVSWGDEYYINVQFKLKQDIKNTKTVGTFNGTWTTSTTEEMIFAAGQEYSLRYHGDSIEDFLKTAEQNEETRTSEKDVNGNEIGYIKEKIGIAEFKRKTFKCAKVEYDNTGKISAMYFTQI